MAGNNSLHLNNVDWFEIRRKIFHIFLGLALMLLLRYDLLKLWMALTILIIGVLISIIYMYVDIPVIHWFLTRFERSHHIKKFPGRGVLFIFLSLTILMIFFQKNIVIASILIWAFGDSVSALVGKHYGTRKHPLNSKRVIEGTIAGIVAAAIAASFFVSIPAAIVASVVAMTIESLELTVFGRQLDDNFLVPIIAALVLLIF